MNVALTEDQNHACQECGMSVTPRAYHPYAACLMFKACHNGNVVQANLDAVVAHGYQMACEEGNWGTIAPIPGQVRVP